MRLSLRLMLAAVLGVAMASLGIAATDTGLQETLKFKVTTNLRFADVFVTPGEYQIVHDDAKKANGDPCLSIWRMKDGKAKERLTAIHCNRVSRKVNAIDKVSGNKITDGTLQVTEVQFAGEAYGHRLLAH